MYSNRYYFRYKIQDRYYFNLLEEATSISEGKAVYRNSTSTPRMQARGVWKAIPRTIDTGEKIYINDCLPGRFAMEVRLRWFWRGAAARKGDITVGYGNLSVKCALSPFQII